MRAYDKKWKELNYEPVTYTVGDVVRLEVDFTAGVSWLAEESPPPRLYIDGLIGRYREFQDLFPDNFTFAKYVSGNGTRFLRFEWEVPDENPLVDAPLPSTGVGRLGYRGVRALVDSSCETTSSGLRRRLPRNASDTESRVRVIIDVPAALGEVAPGALLRDRIDGSKPKIIDVKLSSHSSMVRDAGLAVGVSAFTTGDTIDITVVFSAAVVVEGVPTLFLNARGGEPKSTDEDPPYAYYLTGSGTNELTYRYTVDKRRRRQRSQPRHHPTRVLRRSGAGAGGLTSDLRSQRHGALIVSDDRALALWFEVSSNA